MFTRESAKKALKSKGWTYRTAAPQLSVTYQHLSEVLNGNRESRRLMLRIKQLPHSGIYPATPVLKEDKS